MPEAGLPAPWRTALSGDAGSLWLKRPQKQEKPRSSPMTKRNKRRRASQRARRPVPDPEGGPAVPEPENVPVPVGPDQGPAMANQQVVLPGQSLIKLTKDTYLIWRSTIECCLKMNSLSDIVFKEPPEGMNEQEKGEYEIRDARARFLILSSLGPDQTPIVSETVNAKDLFLKLEERYSHKNPAKIAILRRQLYGHKYNPSEGIQKFIDRVALTVAALRAAGEQISPSEHTNVLISGVPEHMCSDLTVLDDRCQDVSYISSRLVEIESRRNEKSLERDFSTLHVSQRKFKKKGCEICGRTNHVTANCFYRERLADDQLQRDSQASKGKNPPAWQNTKSGQSTPRGGKRAVCMLKCFTSQGDGSNAYLIDSGSNFHTSCDREDFLDLNMSIRPDAYQIDGQKVPVEGIGWAKLRIKGSEQETVELILTECLYCPQGQNILSASRMTQAGFKIAFQGQNCLITNDELDIRLPTTTKNGLFYLQSIGQEIEKEGAEKRTLNPLQLRPTHAPSSNKGAEKEANEPEWGNSAKAPESHQPRQSNLLHRGEINLAVLKSPEDSEPELPINEEAKWQEPQDQKDISGNRDNPHSISRTEGGGVQAWPGTQAKKGAGKCTVEGEGKETAPNADFSNLQTLNEFLQKQGIKAKGEYPCIFIKNHHGEYQCVGNANELMICCQTPGERREISAKSHQTTAMFAEPNEDAKGESAKELNDPSQMQIETTENANPLPSPKQKTFLPERNASSEGGKRAAYSMRANNLTKDQTSPKGDSQTRKAKVYQVQKSTPDTDAIFTSLIKKYKLTYHEEWNAINLNPQLPGFDESWNTEASCQQMTTYRRGVAEWNCANELFSFTGDGG